AAVGVLALHVPVPVRVDVVPALAHAIGLLHAGVALLGRGCVAIAVASLVVEVVRRQLRRPRRTTPSAAGLAGAPDTADAPRSADTAGSTDAPHAAHATDPTDSA